MPAICAIHAREILDSRGRPTLQADVILDEGTRGTASVPSGASTGRHEAVELRDGDPSRYGGLGVRKAVAHVREIIGPALHRKPIENQAQIDQTLLDLDGTTNKSKLGANALLAVSLACARAAALSRKLPLWKHLDHEARAILPMPMVNMISGGLHAGGNLDFQDFLLIPIAATSISQALEQIVAVYRRLGELLRQRGFEGNLVGDEGGYGPKLKSNEQAIELLLEACRLAGLEPGQESAVALDVAATHFYRKGKYHLRSEGGTQLTSDEMIRKLDHWTRIYPIVSIEDGLAEDDDAGWQTLTDTLGDRVQVVGDDRFVTNPALIMAGIESQLANAVLIKLNQIGTLTETLEAVRLAREANWRAVISARSGETEDDFLADFAVATGMGQIKIGSIVRSERLAKYNRLLQIEEQLPRFAGFAMKGS
jgi:enolase